MKNAFNKAFTMAEAILVMTILGIIATIMITTLKPAGYKEDALKILYKKVLSQLDTATTQILVNSSAGSFQLFLVNTVYVTKSKIPTTEITI